MAAKKQKYRVNLIDVFNRAYADKSAEVRSKLRPLLQDSSVKLAVGREVIREIQKRTARGIDKKSDGFTPYSPSYKKSLDFNIFGKSSKVNLKLSGQMLAGMKVDNSLSGANIDVFFPSDLQNAKADGHVRGTGKNNALPVRDFLGLPQEEEEKVLRKVVNDASRNQLTAQFDELLNTSVSRGAEGTTTTSISGVLFGEDDG